MQRTREHLESVNETYFEHMAHAGGFGFKQYTQRLTRRITTSDTRTTRSKRTAHHQP